VASDSGLLVAQALFGREVIVLVGVLKHADLVTTHHPYRLAVTQKRPPASF
jgi:hypothetical protein